MAANLFIRHGVLLGENSGVLVLAYIAVYSGGSELLPLEFIVYEGGQKSSIDIGD